MGDAAGVGPEIIVRGLGHAEVHDWCQPIVVGDAARLRRAAAILGIPAELVVMERPRLTSGRIPCIDVGGIPADLPFGRLSPVAGEAAFRYIERAVALAVSGEVDAICTAPINKAALHAAGRQYAGHTELLAALTGTPEVSMMLSTPRLRVIHCTTHIGLLDAIARIDRGLVCRTIRRGHDTLVQAGMAHPRIAVCGINPHAGENGLFGRGEEERVVAPGVADARAAGVDAMAAARRHPVLPSHAR
jgi:4-hydroxythreonine-4-phosphate dehydrogenase